ncbi:transmembrane protein, putative (macronuclear) [Tetrahymena thermophila SB210]|uniref:Transmembrane protein, putative n=1 Tax=Tetrahymena thermophila (strain SB210) TaxID=312017 RepID=I7LXA2_TETTS|nr:transmembrane protein, putative [Tetrahymena thermophila SB210]EAS04244.2 transmembrane protein, putative [Tetrahymena thermophila SB210]|eukprot:XP_001024489.2 transmembrane protein, putative [Tetrahymena thermophila SB210]
MDLKKIGTIAYMILMVFYGLFTLIVSIQAYTKFTDTSQLYDNIVSNLKEVPIVDIQSKQDLNCDSNYTSLFNWNWGGMSDGCDCTYANTTEISKTMYRGHCSANYTSYGCYNTTGINATTFNFFEGPSNVRMNVCVKRGLSKYAYYKVADQQKGESCVGQKLCGNLQYPKSVFCVSKDDPCPIYDIQVSSASSDPSYVGYSKISLPNGKYLYYDNIGASATKEPLSELRLTQGAGVCQIYNTQKNLPNGQSEYILSIQGRSSCSQFDPTFIQNGFSIPENRYFIMNMNSSDYKILSNYSGIQIPSSTAPFNTYQRNYLSWSIPKRNLMKGFVDASNSLTDLKNAQLVVMIINIFVCIMVSIVLNISEVYNLMGKDVPCFEGSRDEESAKIKKTKTILSYGGKLLQVPFLLWAFIVSAQKKDVISEVANAAPMDPIFNSQILAFSTQLEDQVYKKNLSALIVLAITLFIDVVLILKALCFKNKTPNSQQEPAKPNMDEEQNPVNQNQYPGQPLPQPQYTNIQMQNIQPVGQAQFQGTYQDLPNYGYPAAQPVIQQPGYVQQHNQQPMYAQTVYPQQANAYPQSGYQQGPYIQPVQQNQQYTYPVQQQQQYAYPIQEQQVYAQIQDQEQQLQPVQYVQPIQQEGFVQPTEQPQNFQ